MARPVLVTQASPTANPEMNEMRACWLLSVVVCVMTGLPGMAGATPITNATLVGWTDTSLTVVVDGTANTILFGEQTVVSTCLSQVVSLGSIADGTSNTILLGETTSLCLDDASGVTLTRTTLPGITDGSSNTILIGESGGGYFFGGGARIDLCATNVSLADGTSNTIVLPEGGSVCFADAGIAPVGPSTAVPEPAITMLLAGSALAALATRRRPRRPGQR